MAQKPMLRAEVYARALLANRNVKRAEVRVTVGASFIFYVSSGLEFKHMEKGKIELPCFFFPPARRACGRRFYWGGQVWRALPKGYECFELKITAVSTRLRPPGLVRRCWPSTRRLVRRRRGVLAHLQTWLAADGHGNERGMISFKLAFSAAS